MRQISIFPRKIKIETVSALFAVLVFFSPLFSSKATAQFLSAGLDQTVGSGDTVFLSGNYTGSTASATISWVQSGGTPLVSINSASSLAANFVAPTVATPTSLSFKLTVSVSGPVGSLTFRDEVLITVLPPPNTPPTANAGPHQTVASGAGVTLSGAGSSDSDPGDSVASYIWAQSGGTGVTLTGPTTASPTFTAPTVGFGTAQALTFTLVVHDLSSNVASAPDMVTVTVLGSPNPTITSVTSSATGQAVVQGVSVPGSIVTVTFPDGTSVVVSTDPITGAYQATSSTFPPSGTVSLIASFAGTTSGTVSAAFADVTAPTAPSIDTVNEASDGTLTISGTAEPGSTVTLTFPDGTMASVIAGPTGTYTLSSPPAQPTGTLSATATDAAGNTSATSQISHVSALAVGAIIGEFQASRLTALANGQVDLLPFLTGDRRNGVMVRGESARGNVDMAFANENQTLWFDLSAQWAEDPGMELSYTLGTLGFHTHMGKQVLAGLMVQFDQSEWTDGTATASGSGWLMGPYVVAKSPSRDLYFEGRALFGQTQNEISPFGTYIDRAESDRLLLQAKVSGQLLYSNLVVTPNLDLTYARDTLQGYEDTSGSSIADQNIAMERYALGADFQLALPTASRQIDLVGGVHLIHANTSGTGAANAIEPGSDGTRGRAEFGINLYDLAGGDIQIMSNMDGLGSDYSSYGVNISYGVNF